MRPDDIATERPLLARLSVALFALVMGIGGLAGARAAAAHAFGAVVEAFEHPMRSSFFPAVPVSMVVPSIGVRAYSEPLAWALWCGGTALYPVLAVTFIRRRIPQAQDESVLTPAGFIPVVGNILVDTWQGGKPSERIKGTVRRVFPD